MRSAISSCLHLGFHDTCLRLHTIFCSCVESYRPWWISPYYNVDASLCRKMRLKCGCSALAAWIWKSRTALVKAVHGETHDDRQWSCVAIGKPTDAGVRRRAEQSSDGRGSWNGALATRRRTPFSCAGSHTVVHGLAAKRERPRTSLQPWAALRPELLGWRRAGVIEFLRCAKEMRLVGGSMKARTAPYRN